MKGNVSLSFRAADTLPHLLYSLEMDGKVKEAVEEDIHSNSTYVEVTS